MLLTDNMIVLDIGPASHSLDDEADDGEEARSHKLVTIQL